MPPSSDYGARASSGADAARRAVQSGLLFPPPGGGGGGHEVLSLAGPATPGDGSDHPLTATHSAGDVLVDLTSGEPVFISPGLYAVMVSVTPGIWRTGYHMGLSFSFDIVGAPVSGSMDGVPSGFVPFLSATLVWRVASPGAISLYVAHDSGSPADFSGGLQIQKID